MTARPSGAVCSPPSPSASAIGIIPAIIAKLNAATNAALAPASVKPRFDGLGATPRGTTPGQLAAFLKSEIDKWGPVIRDARIRVEN